MSLLFDIGNTRIKVAKLSDDKLSEVVSFVYKEQNIPQLFTQMLNSFDRPEEVLVSNVAGKEMEGVLTTWIKKNWQSTVQFVQSKKFASGVTNNYLDPAQLGVDRWLGVIAAYSKFHDNVCIFDCGTAITMDLVTAKGDYLGGLIFPGLRSLQTSLINNVEVGKKLLLTDLPIKNQLVATNTLDGILSGTSLGVIAFIEKQRERLLNQLNSEVKFVVTGGDSEALLPHLSNQYEYLPHLVLEGLALVAKK